jgi:UDP-galactopyranose mutase
MYDYLIVGAGLFGATFAKLATDSGKSCVVIESRDHVGGNCHTRRIHGIDVHEYGPHIFHTSNKETWDFVNSITEFEQYTNRVKSLASDGKLYTVPICLATFNELWGVKTPTDAVKKINEVKLKNCDNPENLEDWLLSQVGDELYLKLFKGYTTKQWGMSPKNVPTFVAKRLPIRFTWNDNYYEDTYQGIPKHGYTHLIDKLLEKSNVILGVDYFTNKEALIQLARKTLYTGKIDEFFGYGLGELQYRSCDFEHEVCDISDCQGNAIINYADVTVPYTRCIEHKHFNRQSMFSDKTVITRERPGEHIVGKNVPMYPINDEKNNALYKRYESLAKQQDNVIFGGRLATYRYYDMDDTIEAAMLLAKYHHDKD